MNKGRRAIAGMAAPALVFLAVAMAVGAEGPALGGWAIPTATDIATVAGMALALLTRARVLWR